jgi:peroxiredoxin
MKKKLFMLHIFFSFVVQAQVKVGDALPTFTLLNANSEKVLSSSFKHKFVLIDFWASWCAPCRVGNKGLVELYDMLSQDKIQIIGISVDTDKSKWVKAIAKDKIKYTQLSDPKGFEAATAVQFGVDELPSKFLFNEKGILIAKNPTEEAIIRFIKN